ncbi:hypothetical protein ERN12_16035 [Rhodobacteraceae bacterium]|nr:hypothetical protein ERN12_16035 [Paracoccaceae bacterium]
MRSMPDEVGNVLLILQGRHWTVGVILGALMLGAVLGFLVMLARVRHKIARRWCAIGYIALVRAIPPIV